MEMGIKPSRMEKAKLIRALQQAEKNPCCFETLMAAVRGQEQCLCRQDGA